MKAISNAHCPAQVLYKFANFDPFTRSSYFGRSMDLGQFERHVKTARKERVLLSTATY